MTASLKRPFALNGLAVVVVLTAAFLLSAYSALPGVGDPVFPGQPVPVSYSLPGQELTPGNSHGYGEGRLSPGKILIADGKLRDPHFARTIILLLNYSYRGAAGLILNRPTGMKLHQVLPEVKGLRKTNDSLYIGGPVSANRITMIVQSPEKPAGSSRVFDGIYVSNSLSLLEKLTTDRKPGQRFRLYAGYAGWGPGQLDSEIAREDWRILKGTPDIIFNSIPAKIWRRLSPENISI